MKGTSQSLGGHGYIRRVKPNTDTLGEFMVYLSVGSKMLLGTIIEISEPILILLGLLGTLGNYYSHLRIYFNALGQ